MTDYSDLFSTSQTWQKNSSMAGYNQENDLNHDNVIDSEDILELCNDWHTKQ